MKKADIGIFGGSGLYHFLDDVEEVKVDTPYGAPSDTLAMGSYQGKQVVFIPRHGKQHTIPPHMINYRANLWAFKELGVKFVISPTAAGSLQPDINPGDFVIVDQFVDRTKGRKDTFYDGPVVTHMLGDAPYCDYLRDLAIQASQDTGATIHTSGTVVVINGPRFSTKAESQWFTKMGWHVVNMTQYPEAILARELEMSFVNISMITDYDCGLMGDVPATTVPEMLETFKGNIERVKETLRLMIERIDVLKETPSHQALGPARFH